MSYGYAAGHCGKCDRFSASLDDEGMCPECSTEWVSGLIDDAMRAGAAAAYAHVNDWIQIIRRSRLHSTTKLVALLIASYANSDGTSIYPGVARLAVESGKHYRTVQRELKRLRDTGLIEAMSRKGKPRNWTTVYRLTLPADLAGRVVVLSPDEEQAAIDREAKRQRGYDRHRRRKQPNDSGGKTHDTGDVRTRETHDKNSVNRTTRPPSPPAVMPPLPSIDPPRKSTLHLNESSAVTPTGGRQQPSASNDGFDVSTRDGTSRAQRAQADALTEWQRNNPEAAS